MPLKDLAQHDAVDESANPNPNRRPGSTLGVFCTTPHQLELLTERRRTVRSPGRIALLAFVARQSVSDEQP